MGSDKARPAYVEEEDEAGKAVRGTRQSARTKEKPKVTTRESRPGKSSRRSQDVSYQAEQSTSAQHLEVVSRDKQARLERRGSTSSSTKSPRKSVRPPSAHGNKSFPTLSIPNSSSRQDSTYYGIPSPAGGIPPQHTLAIRPRAQTSGYQRPTSYYATQSSSGAQAPPLSYGASAYYPPVTPSYPPPSSSYMRYAATPQPTQPQYSMAPSYQATTAGADYFTPHASSRPLAARFDPIARTQSAMDTVPRTGSAFGTRILNPRTYETYNYDDGSYYDDGYGSANEVPMATIRRRDSKRKSTRLSAAEAFDKAADARAADIRAMPPPAAPRPQGILRRTTAASYTHDSIEQESDYRDRKQYREEPRARRPSVNRHSVSYDLDNRSGVPVTIEPANTGRRRQSWYDQGASSGKSAASAYEEQMKQASNYQADLGGPTVPLTAEYLRKQQRREAGSSRSTKSSQSRDESDYKKSATTRTTRSGSGGDDENVTIKVTGQARVMVGGAQIDCTEGAIEIKRNQSRRGVDSERSNSEYGDVRQRIEDRQSRVSRPAGRSRMSSQSGQSYTRTPQYPAPTNGGWL